MIKDLYEALYYKKTTGQSVQCMLCPKYCIIDSGNIGNCSVRKNIDGSLYTLIYEQISSIALDPVEKKPLYFFHPNELILSVGTKGCNLKCRFCQNWQISQAAHVSLQQITAKEVVLEAQRMSSFGIAYTYNEPFIWYEYVLETAKLAMEAGLENVLVTNGYVNPEPLEELLPFIGAMNIDLKAMDNEFYKNMCQGALDPVLKTIKTAKNHCHIEITNLIIPTLNDTDNHFKQLTDWIAANVGIDTPVHFSRYFPCFESKLPPTPIETLRRAEAIAKKKLKYVYLGNV